MVKDDSMTAGGSSNEVRFSTAVLLFALPALLAGAAIGATVPDGADLITVAPDRDGFVYRVAVEGTDYGFSVEYVLWDPRADMYVFESIRSGDGGLPSIRIPDENVRWIGEYPTEEE